MIDISPSTGQGYYSGSHNDVLQLIPGLKISEGRFSNGITPENINDIQEQVDRDIDESLGEVYVVPLIPYKTIMPQGTEVSLFPQKVKVIAKWWAAGLIMQSQLSDNAPVSSEMAQAYVNKAMNEINQLVQFNLRLPGQTRKSNISRTMPVGMQPSSRYANGFGGSV